MRVAGTRRIPIPIARRIVEESGDLTNPIVSRTYEYLKRFSKCPDEAAERAYRRLVEELGFKDVTAAMLVSILPGSIDEARVLLNFEDRPVPPEELERALQILQEECGSSSQ